MNTNDLALRITDMASYNGYQLECQPIPGMTDVLQITVQDYDELPAFVSVTDSQILCITNLLWSRGQTRYSRPAHRRNARIKYSYAALGIF